MQPSVVSYDLADNSTWFPKARSIYGTNSTVPQHHFCKYGSDEHKELQFSCPFTVHLSKQDANMDSK